MGRHSAGSEDDSEDGSAASSSVAVVENDRSVGRHSAPPGPAESVEPSESIKPAEAHRPTPGPHREAVSKADTAQIPLITDPIIDSPIPESETVQIPVITAPLLEPPTSRPDPTARPLPKPKSSGHATAADLALLRGHGDVRARALAAVLIPFVGYVVYQLVVGDISSRSFLIWLWIPVVVAGVLFGVSLDAGHKRYNPRSSPDDESADGA